MGNAKYKQKHREQGLCVDCSRPALPFRIHCIIHNEKVRVRTKEWLEKPGNRERRVKSVRKLRQLYRDTNRCCKCSAPLGEQDEGYMTCVNCRDSAVQVIPKSQPISGGLLENYYKTIASAS